MSYTASYKQQEPMRVCIWGSDKLDGQKAIWLQQMRHLDSTEFAFTYILITPPVDNSTTAGSGSSRTSDSMSARMRQLSHVKAVRTSYYSQPVPVKRLRERPGEGEPSYYDIKQEVREVRYSSVYTM